MTTKAKSNQNKRLIKVFGITFGIIFVLAGILLFTPLGKYILTNLVTSHVYNKINYTEKPEDPNNAVLVQKDFQYGKDVVNVLLIGEEAIGYGTARGNTDTLMIATLNKKLNKLKLTSIMRDTWVTIPGYDDNRINSVYAKGDIPLLYQCIEDNFGIKLDGYALVGFDSFEKIIDLLGGIEITLTDMEASYLNQTNYISKPEYRNVTAGTQLLNGNQALGYCRVRKVPTADNLHDDFGRIARQKAIMNSVFQKLKDQSLPKLAQILDGILPLVSTDIPAADFNTMLGMAIDIHPTGFEPLRLPADDAYSMQKIRGKEVILPDYDKNKEILHNFIFEDNLVASDGSNATNQAGTGTN